ncbi:MAG: hypothetical protein QOH61_1060, partial [Chloroflexota bacterium]|nr:hypothetical protein [Chloroflexota bacterium]
MLALEKAVELGAREVELVLDSKLVVEQLLGRWRVKEPSLQPLHARARSLLSGLSRWSVRHEGRASNRQADAMANLALDDAAAAASVERGDLGAVEGRRRRAVDPVAGASLRSPAPTRPAAVSERRSEATAALPSPSVAASPSSAFTPPTGPQAWICVTCGVQYPMSDEPPADCPICEDERQYVGWDGQQWTSMPALAAAGHRNSMSEAEPGLLNLGTDPKIAIGQRALIVRTPAGNVMWDCIT